MAEHERQVPGLELAVAQVQVGPADPAGRDAQPQLAGPGSGAGSSAGSSGAAGFDEHLRTHSADVIPRAAAGRGLHVSEAPQRRLRGVARGRAGGAGRRGRFAERFGRHAAGRAGRRRRTAGRHRPALGRLNGAAGSVERGGPAQPAELPDRRPHPAGAGADRRAAREELGRRHAGCDRVRRGVGHRRGRRIPGPGAQLDHHVRQADGPDRRQAADRRRARRARLAGPPAGLGGDGDHRARVRGHRAASRGRRGPGSGHLGERVRQGQDGPAGGDGAGADRRARPAGVGRRARST